MTFIRNRSTWVLVAAVAALLGVAGSVFAVDVAVVDYTADVAAALLGLVAGVAASIAAVFVVAGLIRATKIGARQALKAMGLIK